MFRPNRRLSTLLLLTALALAGAWPTPAEAAGHAEAAWWQPWDFASRLWSALTAIWGDHGCHSDPNGVCGGGPQPENGCLVDPSGRCVETGGAAATTGDYGCSPDPNGGCGH